jgi:hypothetical protein
VTTLGTAVRELLRRACTVYGDDPRAVALLQDHLARFDEPLRVAFAGKVKAGKSTLLNALVGEEIAPTDAGECTRVVTWYQDAPAPRVRLFSRAGSVQPLTLARKQGALALDLGMPAADVDRLVVDWPSGYLRGTTLIDTPGIASLTADTAARAGDFLTPSDAPSPADAVVYLMRHLHGSDVRFLESFRDTDVARATPVTTIAVLSRADEIGVGRLDALSSAGRIARRYRADPTLRGLCQTVVPVAGLLAQTGRTMRQDEFAALVALAGLPQADLDRLLLSADRFSTRVVDGAPEPAVRAALVERFGLFGVRLATELIRRGMSDPSALSRELVRHSGLDELRSVLTTQFAERRELLKSRSALLALDRVLAVSRPGSAPLVAERERILSGAHEFVELRMLSAIRAGAVKFPADAVEDAERLLGGEGSGAAVRLGLDPDSPAAELRAAALAAVVRWQRRAESPLSSRATADAARVVVRSAEGLVARLT